MSPTHRKRGEGTNSADAVMDNTLPLKSVTGILRLETQRKRKKNTGSKRESCGRLIGGGGGGETEKDLPISQDLL